MARPFGILHIAFLAFFGLAGWSLLVAMTIWRPAIFAPWEVSPELLATAVLVAVSRLLAFRVYRRARIALDSAFYIAVRFAFGTVPAAWLIALALSIDGLVGLLRGRGPLPRGEAPARHTIAYTFYYGGLPCVVFFATSLVFGGDHASLFQVEDLTLLWNVPLFAISFLVVHYFLSGGAAWFTGTSSDTLFRQFFLRVVGAEVTLVPLSLAMVLAFKHQGIQLFLLIGASGLVFGGAFRRLVILSDRLQHRVDELSAINRIGRTISDSYDQKSLFKNLSVASLQLVGHGSLFMIGVGDELGENVAYEIYDNHGECIQQIVAGRRDGISGWVMANKQGLCIGNLQKEYLNYAKDDRYNDAEFHSWLGVPLVVYGDVVGVMSVQARTRHAYNVAHLRVLATIADQAAVAIENSRLYQLATVDGLTGLFVRRYFDQRLVEEWHRASRYGNSFCLGLFDLDHFKRLNDTHGHQVGDQVLRDAAHALRKNMRSFDIAARYGGEEFVFILPRTGLEAGVRVAERIRQDVQAMEVETPHGVVRVTASIGIAAFPGEELEEVADLIAEADAALYRAKANGRNRIEPSRASTGAADEEARQAGGSL